MMMKSYLIKLQILFLCSLATTHIVAQKTKMSLSEEIRYFKESLIESDKQLHTGHIYIGHVKPRSLALSKSYKTLNIEYAEIPFKDTDVRACQQIIIPARKSMVSVYPNRTKNSYAIDSIDRSHSLLRIIEPEPFWTECSNCLVIRTGVDSINGYVNVYDERKCKKEPYKTIRDSIASIKKQYKSKQKIKSMLGNMLFDLDKQLNAVYYIVEDKWELKAKNLISGGFLANYRVTNYPMPKTFFIQKDRRALSKINTDSRHVKIYTPHPKDSYDLVTGDNGRFILMIKDPERFWKLSRYLIIQK